MADLPLDAQQELKKEYDEILREFDKVCEDWKKYEDKIIPEEPEFAKKIIDFFIDVIEYIQNNYEKIDVLKWTEFLMALNDDFQYGNEHRNYLDFDEGSIHKIIIFRDWDEPFQKKELESIKKKIIEIKANF